MVIAQKKESHDDELVDPTDDELVDPTVDELADPTDDELVDPTADELVDPTDDELVDPTIGKFVGKTSGGVGTTSKKSCSRQRFRKAGRGPSGGNEFDNPHQCRKLQP